MMRNLVSACALALALVPSMAFASADSAPSASGPSPSGKGEVLTMNCTKHGASKTYKYKLSIDFASGEFSKSNPSFNVRHHVVQYNDRWVVLGRQVGSQQLPDRTITYDWTEILDRTTGELKTDGYVGPVDMTSSTQCDVAKN